MPSDDAGRTWREVLSALGDDDSLRDRLVRAYGDRAWSLSPADKGAAHAFHIQLVSRVSTQPLGYEHGVEEAALGSLHTLFEKARDVT